MPKRTDLKTILIIGAGAAGLAAAEAAWNTGCKSILLVDRKPSTGGIQGQVSDLEIQAAEIERMRRLMETTLARHTGKDADQIRKDTDRDKILTAAEAVEYGLIDNVLEYRKLSAQK